MTLQEIQKFEEKLEKKGYKKLVRSCKAEDEDDWEWYKAFYSNPAAINELTAKQIRQFDKV